MSLPSVDFYFDVVCPYAYLASKQLERFEGIAQVNWRPFLLGGVLKALGTEGGNAMNQQSTRRLAHNARDLDRWARYHGITLRPPQAHPQRTVLAMRAVVAAPDTEAAAKALFDAYWVDGVDMNDSLALTDVLTSAMLDGERILERTKSDEVKDGLRSLTDAALDAGVFGAPAFVVGDELFWGQDRIVLVLDHLRSSRARGSSIR